MGIMPLVSVLVIVAWAVRAFRTQHADENDS
jgi:hypothetical protein